MWSGTIGVLIPSVLQSYTSGAKRVELAVAHDAQKGLSLNDVLAALDARFPGFRFRIIDEQDRIRAHIKIFVDAELARDPAVSLTPTSEVMIVGALSGG